MVLLFSEEAAIFRVAHADYGGYIMPFTSTRRPDMSDRMDWPNRVNIRLAKLTACINMKCM